MPDSPHTNIALPAVVAGLPLIVLTLVYMWRRHKGLFSCQQDDILHPVVSDTDRSGNV